MVVQTGLKEETRMLRQEWFGSINNEGGGTGKTFMSDGSQDSIATVGEEVVTSMSEVFYPLPGL